MIRIITDSTCDLSQQQAEQMGIEIARLSVNFGASSFVDGTELSHADFYARLDKADELPTTSQVTPQAFEQLFRNCLEAGDEVLCLTLSSQLSGTYQSAIIARDMVGGDNIHIIDTKAVTFGLGLLVSVAAQRRDEGASIEAIAQEIMPLIDKLRLVAMVSSLKYLKKGGRLSATSAVIGTVLGIRPIVAVKDGLVSAIGKARGQKSAMREMHDMVAKEGVDTRYPIAFGHSNDPEIYQVCLNTFADFSKKASSILHGSIGCVVGTHAGPGAAGVAYIAR